MLPALTAPRRSTMHSRSRRHLVDSRAAQTEATQDDADLASQLIASGVTTQPVETVIEVLAASRDGASINAVAKASGIMRSGSWRLLQPL